jgi:hypothetical protein
LKRGSASAACAVRTALHSIRVRISIWLRTLTGW